MLFCFNHFLSLHFRPQLLFVLFSFSSSVLHPRSASCFFPPHNFLLNPNILFIYLHGMPLSTSLLSFGLSLPERLTIPSASPLIYHPNGGYKREKTTICWGRNSHRGAWKVFGLQLLFKFSLPTVLLTWPELFLMAEIGICNTTVCVVYVCTSTLTGIKIT